MQIAGRRVGRAKARLLGRELAEERQQPQRVCSLSYRTPRFNQWLAQRRETPQRPRLRRATLATSSSSHNSKRPEDECHGGRARPRPAFDAWPVNPARAFFIIQSRSNQGPKTRAQPPRRGDGRLLGHRRHTVAARRPPQPPQPPPSIDATTIVAHGLRRRPRARRADQRWPSGTRSRLSRSRGSARVRSHHTRRAAQVRPGSRERPRAPAPRTRHAVR